MTTGLIIGRFQPFHIGHYESIKAVIKKENLDKIIIGIGSAQLQNLLENPFSYDERKLMIKLSFKKEDNIEIYPVIDINDYDKWVQHVIKEVPAFDYILTNNKVTKELFEKNGYSVKSLPIKSLISGTEIRKLIANGKNYSESLPNGTKIILEEVKGADKIKRLHNKVYRNPIPATDVIIELYEKGSGHKPFFSGRLEEYKQYKHRKSIYEPCKGLVFIERKNPPYGIALPGGFHEYGLSGEENVIKEAKEETGLDIKITGQLGLYSDPDRDPRSHVISTVFMAKAYGIPKAGDDAKKVLVLRRNEIPKLVFDHNKIIKDYLIT